MNKLPSLFFALLFAFLLFAVMTFFSHQSTRETVIVARVIDGDTLQLDDGRVVRLSNINAPEKNVPASAQSKAYLSSFTHRSLDLEITGTDKYHRLLARLTTDATYINLELVKQGFASKFLVNDREIKEFADAEADAIENKRGIWNHSRAYGCFTTDIDKKHEVVVLTNHCSVLSLEGWQLKDESRKTLTLHTTLEKEHALRIHSGIGATNATDLFFNTSTEIWNNDRDTLYLFDAEGNIAHVDTYGY